MHALPHLLLGLLLQDPPASRPSVTLHSGTLGAVVGLHGAVLGLSTADGAARLSTAAAISLPGGGWQELGELPLVPRFEEDSEVLVLSHTLVTVRIALPRGSDVLALAFAFPRRTRLRFTLRAEAGAGIDFALDVPSQPVASDTGSVARETELVTSACVVLVRAAEAQARQSALARAVAGVPGLLEWAGSDGPTWLSAGLRTRSAEPQLDHLFRRSLLQLRAAEAGSSAGSGLGAAAELAARTRVATALAVAGHAGEAARLLALPAPDGALAAARRLTATMTVWSRCSEPMLRARLLAQARALAGILHAAAAPAAERGVAACFPDGEPPTTQVAGEVLAGLAAAASVLAPERAGDSAALQKTLDTLRARLREDAWRPELSRLVASRTAAAADSGLLDLCTGALLLPGTSVLPPFDERMEATNARVLDRLLTADGLLGSSGEWREGSTFTPGSPHPAAAATCALVARRLLLGDADGARRSLMALVRKASAPRSHPLGLLPAAWHHTTGVPMGEPSPAAAAEFVLAALQFLVGAQPPADPSKADLVIAPSFPEDWRVSKAVNCPDPKGAFDLELSREERGVRLRLTRRRGESVRILLRGSQTLAAPAETVLEVAPGKPAELLLAPTPRPAFKLVPGEPIILPSAPAELRQRILAWVEAERLLAGRDLTKDLQHQNAPFDGDVAGYSAVVESLRRQAEARFEARRTSGR